MDSIYWLILLCILIFIEIITLGLTTIWFAGGSLVAFLAALIGAPTPIQIALFVVVSLVLLIFTRPFAMRYLNKNREATNVDSLMGKEARVVEKINNLNGTGSVIVNGQEWSARISPEETVTTIDINTIVVIEKISGVKLIVKLK